MSGAPQPGSGRKHRIPVLPPEPGRIAPGSTHVVLAAVGRTWQPVLGFGSAVEASLAVERARDAGDRRELYSAPIDDVTWCRST